MHLCENTSGVKTHIGLMTVSGKVFEEASKITSFSRTTYCYKMTALNCNFIAQNRINFLSLIPITEVFVDIARWRISSISGKRILIIYLDTFKQSKCRSAFVHIYCSQQRVNLQYCKKID